MQCRSYRSKHRGRSLPDGRTQGGRQIQTRRTRAPGTTRTMPECSREWFEKRGHHDVQEEEVRSFQRLVFLASLFHGERSIQVEIADRSTRVRRLFGLLDSLLEFLLQQFRRVFLGFHRLTEN